MRNQPRSRAEVYREARIYPSGEVTVFKRVRNSAARPPAPRYGPRFVSGVSIPGARTLRRVTVARSQVGPAAFKMLTLTSRDVRSDEEMKAALERLLAWLRKYWRGWSRWYVWAGELQQRGVLHFHLLFDQRIPKPLFLRLRRLWAEVYGMGSGSVDIKHMRSGKGAAKYLGKYLGKGPTGAVARLDGEGRIGFHAWPVSRHNGKPYERSRFRGNAFGVSKAARWAVAPVTIFTAPSGAFVGLDEWHGTHRYTRSVDAAHDLLASVLAGRSPPPRRIDANA